MSLIDELELRLGTMECGWSEDPVDGRLPYSIGQFSGVNYLGGRAFLFSTIGLSHHALITRPRFGSVKQELLIAVRTDPNRYIPGLLHQIAKRLLDQHVAIRQGEVIGPFGPLFPETTMSALLAADLGWLDCYHAPINDNGHFIDLVLMVAIGANEASYVSQESPAALHAQFLEHSVDIADTTRSELF